MDEKLPETTNLGVEIMNSNRQVKRKLWSCGTNSHLPFDVNKMLNLSNNARVFTFTKDKRWKLREKSKVM